MRQKSKLFLINGTILTSTALLMKFAALIFNIYISNQIGSEAVGIFSLVMAVYLFFITVATSGLNIAVTVIVSEKFALNKNKQAIKAIRTCIFFSLILGITAGGLILLFSDFITNKCLHNMVSSKPLFYIAIGLPFIAMSSCINSYFTSIRKAYKNAITQVFEFTIKMIATIILLKINISNGVEAVCISLILADVISEICSFTLIFILYIIDIRIKKLEDVRSFGQRFNILKKGTINHISIYLILMILVILLSMVSISYMCSRQNYIELTDNKISILDAKKVSHLKLSYFVLKRELTAIMENYNWEDLEYVEIKLVIKYGGIGMGTSKTMYYYLPKYIFHFKNSSSKSFLEWNNPKAAYQILRNKNIEIVTSDEILDCFEQKELSVYDFFENIYHKNGKNR